MKVTSMSVLLTGATGGIGTQIAEQLVRSGARVLLVARRPGPLTVLAARLGGQAVGGSRVAARVADITRTADRDALLQAAIERNVNVLINGAGTPCFGEFAAMDDTEIAQSVLTNLVAPMQLSRVLLPQLLAQPEARLLNLGSALGRIGLPGYAVYGAGKFGLRGYTEALRRELADTSVRVQYLGPRATRTAFNDHRVEAYNLATRTSVDTPEWVARAAVKQLVEGSAERFLGFPETVAVRLNSIVPTWLDRAFKRQRAALRAAIRLPAA
jgi:short-subunit dehydrogenase